MTTEEIEKKLHQLSGQILGLRDVVARLVAYQAARSSDKEALFQEISEATNYRIHGIQKGRDPTLDALRFQEEWQRTVDWIVAAARKMGEGGTDGTSH